MRRAITLIGRSQGLCTFRKPRTFANAIHLPRKFQKGKRAPQVGDEIEFDGHLVTVENIAEDTENSASLVVS